MLRNKATEKTTRYDAMMADVTIMGQEIEQRHYSTPKKITAPGGRVFEVIEDPTSQRRKGPDRVMISRVEKVTIADMFPANQWSQLKNVISTNN